MRVLIVVLFSTLTISIVNSQGTSRWLANMNCDCIESKLDTLKDRSVIPVVEGCMKFVMDSMKNDESLQDYYADSERMAAMISQMKIDLYTTCEKLIKYQERYFKTQDNKSAEKLPDDIKKKYTKGEDLMKRKVYPEALKLFDEVIKADSSFAFAYINLANCYRGLRQKDTAMYYLQLSTKYAPHMNAYQAIGDIYLSRKDLRAAFMAYVKIIEINSANPEGYFGIGKVLLINKEYDKAIMNIEYAMKLYKILEDDYYKDAVFMMGYIHALKGEKRIAREYLDQARELGFEVPNSVSKLVED